MAGRNTGSRTRGAVGEPGGRKRRACRPVAVGADEIALIAERAAKAAERAARSARKAADRAATFARENRAGTLADADQSVVDTRAEEVTAHERYHEAEQVARARHGA